MIPEEKESRYYAAYNIAAVNAILGRTADSIKWLSILLENNFDMWRKDVEEDKDFDFIREDQRFKNILMSHP